MIERYTRTDCGWHLEQRNIISETAETVCYECVLNDPSIEDERIIKTVSRKEWDYWLETGRDIPNTSR